MSLHRELRTVIVQRCGALSVGEEGLKYNKSDVACIEISTERKSIVEGV
jgi:hypothetical protein